MHFSHLLPKISTPSPLSGCIIRETREVLLSERFALVRDPGTQNPEPGTWNLSLRSPPLARGLSAVFIWSSPVFENEHTFSPIRQLMDEAMDVSLEVISQNLREPFGEVSGNSSGDADESEGRGGGKSFPLAKLVPHVASAASDVLAAPTDDAKPVRHGYDPRAGLGGDGKLSKR